MLSNILFKALSVFDKRSYEYLQYLQYLRDNFDERVKNTITAKKNKLNEIDLKDIKIRGKHIGIIGGFGSVFNTNKPGYVIKKLSSSSNNKSIRLKKIKPILRELKYILHFKIYSNSPIELLLSKVNIIPKLRDFKACIEENLISNITLYKKFISIIKKLNKYKRREVHTNIYDFIFDLIKNNNKDSNSINSKIKDLNSKIIELSKLLLGILENVKIESLISKTYICVMIDIDDILLNKEKLKYTLANFPYKIGNKGLQNSEIKSILRHLNNENFNNNEKLKKESVKDKIEYYRNYVIVSYYRIFFNLLKSFINVIDNKSDNSVLFKILLDSKILNNKYELLDKKEEVYMNKLCIMCLQFIAQLDLANKELYEKSKELIDEGATHIVMQMDNKIENLGFIKKKLVN